MADDRYRHYGRDPWRDPEAERREDWRGRHGHEAADPRGERGYPGPFPYGAAGPWPFGIGGFGYPGAYGYPTPGAYPGYDRPRGAGPYGPAEGYHGDRNFFERAGDEIATWFGDDDAERRRRRDARQGDMGAEHHRGKGPKGYTRSDDRIQEDASDRLMDDPHIDATDIEVSVAGGEVTLNGTVSNRFSKRHAEDLVDGVPGVSHVQNNLRIRPAQTAASDTLAGGRGL